MELPSATPVGRSGHRHEFLVSRTGGRGWAASLCVFLFHVAGQVGSVQVRPGGDTQGTRTHRHVPLFLPGFPVARGAGMPSCHPLSLLLLSLGRCPLPLPPRGQRGCGTATSARVRVSFLSRFPAPLPRSGQARGQGHVHALFSFPLSSFPPASLSLPVCSLSLPLSFSGEGFSSSFSRR